MSRSVDRRNGVRAVLLAAAILALAFALRSVALYWSPHPSTLDGFVYAWRAQNAAATGSYALERFRVDSFGYTGLLAVAGVVFDARPLRAIQPLTSLVGTAGVLLGMVVARRVAGELAWSRRRRRAAVLLTGALLAVNGLYVRRTSVADEEVLALVVLPCLVLALHLAFRTHRRGWYALAAVMLVALPPTHVLSTLVTGLSILALAVAHLAREPTRRTFLASTAVVGGFWCYFAVFYRGAMVATSLAVPYVDRVTAYPGVFLAWVVVCCVIVAWAPTLSRRARQAAFLLPILGMLAVFVANAFVPIYPGTAATPLFLVGPVASLFAFALAAARGSAVLSRTRPAGAMIVALLCAPLGIVGFSLTASLTPEYFGTIMRTQTFVHPPVAILAGLGLALVLPRVSDALAATRVRDSPARSAADGGRSSPPSRVRTGARYALVALVLVATLGSLPLAYVNLDTVTYPSTTLDSEFSAVRFTAHHVEGPWAGDHSLTRVGSHYFAATTSHAATASFLRGSPPPACPVVSQDSWTTTGAHLFPAAAATTDADRYEAWLSGRDVVYANTGRDPVTVSLPRTAAARC